LRSPADGGEGFAQTAASVLSGEWVSCQTIDALHRPLTASYYFSGKTAYIDMASASGLDKLDPSELSPWESSTRGTGILIRHAIEISSAEEIIIGLGGSATNDGGCGMAHELGLRFYDKMGKSLAPIPQELESCTSIDSSGLITLPAITAACDVTNPLLGPQGASAIYGPQKGITDIDRFDQLLEHLAQLSDGKQGAELIHQEGSGAAGGMGYGLMNYCGASLKPGFDLVAQMTRLEESIQNADIIITGEGSLDKQTLNGKGPHGVALLAKKHQKKVYAIAGKIDPVTDPFFNKSYSLISEGYPLEQCLQEAPKLIAEISAKWAKEELL